MSFISYMHWVKHLTKINNNVLNILNIAGELGRTINNLFD